MGNSVNMHIRSDCWHGLDLQCTSSVHLLKGWFHLVVLLGDVQPFCSGANWKKTAPRDMLEGDIWYLATSSLSTYSCSHVVKVSIMWLLCNPVAHRRLKGYGQVNFEHYHHEAKQNFVCVCVFVCTFYLG